jgi:hypothetical protein
MIDQDNWNISNYDKKKKIIENWKNICIHKQIPSRYSTEEDADRRNIGRLNKIKLTGKRVRLSRDDISPDDTNIGTRHPSNNNNNIIITNTSTLNTPQFNDNLLSLGSFSPRFSSCEDIICSVTDVNNSVMNINSNRQNSFNDNNCNNQMFNNNNNTVPKDDTYGVNNNKRVLRSSVRKDKSCEGYCYTSPIILSDDINEPINNSYNNLGTSNCPSSRAIALLTTLSTLYSFIDGNCTVHAFVDSIYKCCEVYS